MAYYQFDPTFVNLGSLPPAANEVRIIARAEAVSGESMHYIMAPFAGSVSVSFDTRNWEFYTPAFELSPADKVWFSVLIYDSSYSPLGVYVLGPYAAGDAGVEVSPP